MCVLFLAAAPLMGGEPQAQQSKPATKAVAAPSTASSMVAVKDKETGGLRAPTAAELKSLMGPVLVTAAEPREVILPDGTQALFMPPDTMDYVVMTKKADGTTAFTCVQGKAAAERAAKAAPAKEVRDDR